MRVYAPTWFQIKRNSSYSPGPRNLWFMISNSRYLTDNLKSVIDPVIQRNAYFAHTENILIAMLFDSRQEIRNWPSIELWWLETKQERQGPGSLLYLN